MEVMEDRLALSANLPSVAIETVIVETIDDAVHDTVMTSTATSDEDLETLALLNITTNYNAKYDEMTGLDTVKELYGLDGSGQTVIVIDSGIAYTHAGLGGGLGEGYRVVGGYDFADNDDDPYDSGPRGSHGTHVAGIIASDGSTYSGVATGVDLVAVRIFSDDGTSDMQYLINALEWVYNNLDSFENPVTTINLSIGYMDDSGGYYEQINEWFRLLNEEGIFISVAAGNSFQSLTDQSQLSYPAMSEYVVSVGSVGPSGGISSFSQRDEDTIMAPGQYVKSTVPDYVGNNNGVDDDYSSFSGTSMAAPYVAGASTLIRQAMELVGVTDITQQMIYDVIVATADKIYDAVTGQFYSRINVLNAVESILPADTLADTIGDATGLGTVVDTIDVEGFFNTKTDNDYFSFVAAKDGTIVITPDMSDGLTGTWDVGAISGAVVNSDGTVTIDVKAGQSYTLGFNATGTIGAYTLNARYAGSSNSSGEKDDGDTGNSNNGSNDNDTGDDTQNSGTGTNTDTNDKTDNQTDNDSGDYVDDTGGNSDNHSDNGNDNGNGTNGSDQQDDLDQSGNGQNTGDNTSNIDQNEQTGTVAITVDQATLDNQRLNESGQWYAVTATNTGTMTVEVMLPTGVSASDVVIEIGDADGNVTQMYAGESRIDFNMTAGTTVWVRVRTASGAGTIDGASIRLTNLLRQTGTKIDVIGTDGNDEISFVAGTTHTLIVNGVLYAFDATAVSRINIDTRGGNDSVYLTGTSAAETVTVDGTDATFAGSGYTVTAVHAEYLVIDGNGGCDTFRYYDTDGDDSVTVRTGEITVASQCFFAQVFGATKFFAYANRGGNDSATLYDSPDNDTLNVSSTYTLFKSGGTTSQLYSFESLVAHSVNGGNDTATITDSTGTNLFTGSHESMKRYSDNQYVEARGFAQVNLTAVYGGSNTVRLEDGAGDETLYISSGNVTLNGDHYGISVRGFDYVHTSSVNGGNDTIMIYDTHKTQMITAARNMISIVDSLHTCEADGFAEVWAFGNGTQSSKIEKSGTDYILNLLGQWDDVATS